MNAASVDLVYLDPPFNSNRDYAAPIGSAAAGAAFKDTWELSDLDDAWHTEIADRDPGLYKAIEASAYTHSDGMKSYLIMMALRLLELRRVLKETAGLYLHCDPTASHYLKVLMDAIFGRQQFRNEIVWAYTGPSNVRRWFPRKHDTILFYAGPDAPFYRDAVRVPYKAESFTMGGSGSLATKNRTGDYRTGAAEQLARGKVVEDYWTDIPALSVSGERVGFPTQKPLALLERIILASSNPGDVVLDPFCGCATACVAAEKLERQWVGIDISPKAAELVKLRLRETPGIGMLWQGEHRTDIPVRTDLGPAPPKRESKVKLYGEQGGDCNGCGTHFEPRNLTIDHIIPEKRGGTDHIENLQLLCGSCNSIKGDRPMQYLRVRLARLSAV